MEGKFTASPVYWDPNRTECIGEIKYIGEGPFNGQQIIRELGIPCSGDCQDYDAAIELELKGANMGLQSIPKEREFANLDELLKSAIANNPGYKLMKSIAEKIYNQGLLRPFS